MSPLLLALHVVVGIVAVGAVLWFYAWEQYWKGVARIWENTYSSELYNHNAANENLKAVVAALQEERATSAVLAQDCNELEDENAALRERLEAALEALDSLGNAAHECLDVINGHSCDHDDDQCCPDCCDCDGEPDDGIVAFNPSNN